VSGAGGALGWEPSLGRWTVIIAHTAFAISYVAVIVRARLVGLSKTFEEAAMDLGATEWQALTRITLPLIRPAMLGGGLLSFTLSLDEFVLTFFTTGPGTTTLPIQVWSMVKRGVTPEINALSALMYATNEDLRAKLQAGASGYDLIVPSDYMVTILRNDGLLAELDVQRIPHLRHVAARFRDPPYDPGHRYSVPFKWGTTGIGYHKSRVTPAPWRRRNSRRSTSSSPRRARWSSWTTGRSPGAPAIKRWQSS
jgi:hypothetical protein